MKGVGGWNLGRLHAEWKTRCDPGRPDPERILGAVPPVAAGVGERGGGFWPGRGAARDGSEGWGGGLRRVLSESRGGRRRRPTVAS